MKAWLYQHSMSIVCAALWVVFSWLGWFVAQEDNNWLYDWSLCMAGIFGGVAALLIFAHFLWEKGGDPAEPPS
jgi:membrane protein DedA with SNARE-associated domain